MGPILIIMTQECFDSSMGAFMIRGLLYLLVAGKHLAARHDHDVDDDDNDYDHDDDDEDGL